MKDFFEGTKTQYHSIIEELQLYNVIEFGV